jgi:peptide deformylase
MLSLTTIPTKTLREPSRKVSPEELQTESMQTFCRDMVPAMYLYEGIGLAAPQVNKNIRICVIGKLADKSLDKDLVLINPEMELLSKRKNNDTEGCLSVPDTFGKVKRASHISVTALDTTGSPINFQAKGFFARVIQHEIDHLDGKLFIDRADETYDVSPADKLAHAREMRNQRKITYDDKD